VARSFRTGLRRRLLAPALLAPAILAGLHPAAVLAEPAPDDDVVELHIEAPPPPIDVGAPHVFTVRGRTQSGTVVDLAGRVEVSSNREDPCVDVTCTPTVTGPHTIRASLRGHSDVVDSVEVEVVRIERIDLRPRAATVGIDEDQEYVARGMSEREDDLGDVTARTELSITKPGSCDQKRHACRSHRAGDYRVRGHLRDGEAEDGATSLTVIAPSLDRIELTPPTARVVVNATQLYQAEGFDSSGRSLGDVLDRIILDIDKGGRCDRAGCSGERSGTYTVTATGVGVPHPGRATLIVVDPPPVELVLRPGRARITAGAEQPFRVLARDADHRFVGDVTGQATLTIRKPGVCDPDSCTATVPGGYPVTAQLDLEDRSSLVATATLTVVPDRVKRLELRPGSDEIVAGARRAYTAFGFDRFDNRLGDVTARTTFSIDKSGRCDGASCGADRIGRYTVTGEHARTGTKGTATLLVRAGPLARLVLDPRGATVTAGDAVSFAARGLDSLGNDVGDLTAESVFAMEGGSCVRESCSSDEPGDHTVTATRIGTPVRGQAVVHVVVGPLARAVLEPATATVTVGASVRYRVRGFDARGNPRGEATDRAVLSITPDGSCSGSSCTPAVRGLHTVTARIPQLGTLAVTLDARAAPVASLRLQPSVATIAVGASQPYEVEAFDAGGASLGIVTQAVRLTIDRGGSCDRAVCTAREQGAYEVQATLPGTQVSGRAVLHVRPGTPALLTLDPPAATVTVRSTQVFRAEAYDAAGIFLGDVTRQTRFSIEPDGSCAGSSCTVDAAGGHTVTGRTVVGSARGTAALTVVDAPPPRPKPTVTGPTVTGPTVTGPTVTGPTVTGPTVTGPTVTGPTGPTGGPGPPVGGMTGIVAQPATGQVAAGAWFALSVRAVDATGRQLGDLTPEATMEIGPDGTCTVGRCTAQAAGRHTVIITARGLRTAATLDVVATARVALITLDPQVSSVRTDAGQVYRALAFDVYGNSLGDVTDRTAFWIEGVGPCPGATCSVAAPGDYEITGIVRDIGIGNTARLDVVPVPAATLVLDPSSGSVPPGQPMAFRMRGYDDVGNDLGDLTGTTRFSIRPGGRCSPAGCTADAPGRYTVTGSVAAGAAGSVLRADAALEVLTLRSAGLPVPAWLIGIVAAVVAVSSGGVLAWAFPGSAGGAGQSVERHRRTDRDDRPRRAADLTVRPVPGRPGTRLRQHHPLRHPPPIRVQTHGDPDGVQTVREGPP
jgi:hypothetical protein